MSSSASGATSSCANAVWRRDWASNGEIRTSRWTPRSAANRPYAFSPLAMKRRRLDPRLLARRRLLHLDVEAAALGPAQVHAQQHLGPVLRVGAAGAGADGDDGVAGVVLAAEQPRLLELGEPALDRVELALELGRDPVVLDRQLGELLEVVELARAAAEASRAASAPGRAPTTSSPPAPGRPRSRRPASRPRAGYLRLRVRPGQR